MGEEKINCIAEPIGLSDSFASISFVMLWPGLRCCSVLIRTTAAASQSEGREGFDRRSQQQPSNGLQLRFASAEEA
jgi:hypothetical protein